MTLAAWTRPRACSVRVADPAGITRASTDRDIGAGPE